jgi:hypothetical protein
MSPVVVPNLSLLIGQNAGTSTMPIVDDYAAIAAEMRRIRAERVASL